MPMNTYFSMCLLRRKSGNFISPALVYELIFIALLESLEVITLAIMNNSHGSEEDFGG